MPSERFKHGYAHDVFLSYTHADDQPDAGRRWVTQFVSDLEARLQSVSGKSVNIWRDESRLAAADRFNDTIAQALRSSAILVVVLSPSYFASEYCRKEREVFSDHARAEGKESVGTRSRVVKVAKFRVGLEKYPPDLRELLEHKFFVESPNSTMCREFHLSDDPAIRERYKTRIDDVAQEVANLLAALEPARPLAESNGLVYLAETTSDLEPQRDELRRQLEQLRYEVQPRAELRLLSARELRNAVAEMIEKCQIAIHPVGAYYGIVPEGVEGKSVVQIQLELAKTASRNGDLPKIIWVPEGMVPQEEVQKRFLERLRTEFAGRGFDFLEGPYSAMATRVEDRLKASARGSRDVSAPPSGVYLVCGNRDRSLAKTLRSFLFHQRFQVEWPPNSLNSDELTGNPEHQKLMRRNSAHLVVHGETGEGWIQDRIRELNEVQQQGTISSQTTSPQAIPRQAIYLANPRRDDKEDILVHDIVLLEGYAPSAVGDVLKPYLDRIGGTAAAAPSATEDAASAAGGLS